MKDLEIFSGKLYLIICILYQLIAKGGPKEILDNGKYGLLINDYNINHFKEAIMKKLNTKKKH